MKTPSAELFLGQISALFEVTVPFHDRGSLWGRWDLHFHTPASFDYKNGSLTNELIVEVLKKAGVSVVAITDHHTIDVPRIRALQALAADDLTVLPGIEFRTELGGEREGTPHRDLPRRRKSGRTLDKAEREA